MRANCIDNGSPNGKSRAFDGSVLLVLTGGLLISTGRASTPAGSRRVSPEAASILKPMCNTLDGARTYRFRVSATMDEPTATGQLAQFHRMSEIAVAKPDRLLDTQRVPFAHERAGSHIDRNGPNSGDRA